MAQYQYTSLRHGELRLLELHPGERSAELQGNLVPRPFSSLSPNQPSNASTWDESPSEARSTLQYYALSYTWGKEEESSYMKILSENRAHSLPIKSNLESALRQLRGKDTTKVFWIDAICINQKDQDEKSVQIPMMTQIYSKATQVCVWLGPERDGSSQAIKFIKQCLDLDTLDQAAQEALLSEEWRALSALMRRPWFSRRWIVQELALAKEAIIYCGTDQIPWTDFSDAVSLFLHKQDDIRQIFRKLERFKNHPDYIGDLTELGAVQLVDASANLFRKTNSGRITEHLLSLEALMSSLSVFEATDPRDIVYAVLWLAHDAKPVNKNAFKMNPQAWDMLGLLGPDVIADVGFTVSSPTESPMSTISEEPAAKRIRTSGLSANSNPDALQLGTPQPRRHSTVGSPEVVRPVNQRSHSANIRLSPHDLGRRRSRSDVLVREPLEEATSTLASSSVNTTNVAQSNGNRGASVHSRQTSLDSNGERRTQVSQQMRGVKRFFENLMERRFTVDYNKDVFEVYYEFLQFSVERSKSLDMMCRPWAPDVPGLPKLPSWIPRVSQGAFGKNARGIYRRVSADALVGRPGLDSKWYSAAPSTVAKWNTKPGDRRVLVVSGWHLDQIKSRCDPAVGGNIPAEWLEAIRWDNMSHFPPEDFWRTLVGNRNHQGQKAARLWRRVCRDAFNKTELGGDLNTADVLHYDSPSSMKPFLERVQSVCFKRRLVFFKNMSKGSQLRLGLAPQAAKEDDYVCILNGCSVPVLLRPVKQTAGGSDLEVPSDNGNNEVSPPEQQFTLVGECYVHGMMDGEALRYIPDHKIKERAFELMGRCPCTYTPMYGYRNKLFKHYSVFPSSNMGLVVAALAHLQHAVRCVPIPQRRLPAPNVPRSPITAQQLRHYQNHTVAHKDGDMYARGNSLMHQDDRGQQDASRTAGSSINYIAKQGKIPPVVSYPIPFAPAVPAEPTSSETSLY